MNRIDRLTPGQEARMAEWADKWIEIGLRTEAADRDLFERGVRECYRYAGIPWPGRVVWVPSPLVASIAGPVAALVIQLHRSKPVGDAVDAAVDSAVDAAV